MGDNDGVIVIPRQNEAEVLKQVELMREARDYVDSMTQKGVDLWDIPGVKRNVGRERVRQRISLEDIRGLE